LKELEARRQQEARNKAMKMGVGEEEIQQEGGKHPVIRESRTCPIKDKILFYSAESGRCLQIRPPS
jgi:hypothetical protein